MLSLIYYNFDFDFERVAVWICGSCKFGLGFIPLYLFPLAMHNLFLVNTKYNVHYNN